MSEQERDEFLQQSNVAVLASVDSRGRAHAAPIWYAYEDGVFLMSTGKGSQKHVNLEAHPDVTLVVDRRTLPYYAVMVQGAVEIGPALDEATRRRIAGRYLTPEQLEAYLASAGGLESVSIRLKPRKFIEFHGRAGRG